jgi:hypothetical protein
MFIVTIVKSSHTLPTSEINSFKDMALTLVPTLANINPTPSSLMIQYKGCREYSCVEDGTNNVTFEHVTSTFQDELNPYLKLVEIMKLPPSHETVQVELGVIAMEIENPPITNQKDQMPKVAILDALLIVEVKLGNGNEDSEHECRVVNYESE